MTRNGSKEAAIINSTDCNFSARGIDGPSWRWRRAEELVASSREPSRFDDPATFAGWRFCRDFTLGNVADLCRLPAAAHAIYSQNQSERWHIEARLLTGATVESVAQRVGISAKVVQSYADLFFDVVGHLKARDWISTSAVGVGPWGPCDPNEADIWRWAAFAGGEIVLDLLVADYLSLPEPVFPNRHELAESIRTLVRLICVPVENRQLFRRVLRDLKAMEAKRTDTRVPAGCETMAGHIAMLELVVAEPGSEPGVHHTEGDARSETNNRKDEERRKSRRSKLVGGGQTAGV